MFQRDSLDRLQRIVKKMRIDLAAQVFQLIRRLADCTVTPTALADVLADWEGTL